jgi:hypothetical protein
LMENDLPDFVCHKLYVFVDTSQTNKPSQTDENLEESWKMPVIWYTLNLRTRESSAFNARERILFPGKRQKAIQCRKKSVVKRMSIEDCPVLYSLEIADDFAVVADFADAVGGERIAPVAPEMS